MSADKQSRRIWTDADKAAAEDPDYLLQGEYVSEGVGVQAAALGKGTFYVSRFKGGLPGQGWDKSNPHVELINTESLRKSINGMKRTERVSPTLGARPPEGATILFDGKKTEHINGQIKDGLLMAGAQTTGNYGDFTLHLEFRLPYKPDSPLSSQDRGNSGIYLQNRYETQILDSFGLVYERDLVKVPLKSDPKQWCGCFYKFKAADIPMCFPPLRWQTYDIDFIAPKFNSGKKISDATITVKHNGIIIHDKVKLPKGTGAGGGRKEVPEGPIIFQGHGNPVTFKNVWILPR
ncbi:MAG: DUF1080 domain-containing protein [Verrucomicrobiota bacterium]|nr:DUF1080 domain-containing protein [Verrucomicrobiota bacterium]MED6300501.1 DUF1080 domain-containing protein [Verrucomicrobiota bacterium]